MNDNGGFRINGWMVLAGLVAFFGLVAAANAVMIWMALSTNTGVVVSSSYKAGNGFQADLDAAHAQAARNWQVEADLARAGEGAAIDILVRDAAGAPVSGLAVTARLESPMSESSDRLATLAEGETGRYRGAVDALAAGNWLLVIDALKGEERVFHSENRVMLR